MKLFKPPKSAQRNALRSRKCLSQGSKAMTRVGRYRSKQLASGKSVSFGVVKRMASFGRHERNKSFVGNPCSDRGWVAWQGWGGSSGVNWAKRLVKKHKGMK